MAYRFLNPFSILFFATGLLSFGISAFALRNRSKRVSVALAWFMLGVGIWCIADALRIAAPNRSHILFWNKVSYVGIVMVPPPFVTFILSVTNRERWLKRRYILGMIAISVLALSVVLTNHLHGLWRASEVVTPHDPPLVLDERHGYLWYPWVLWVYTLVPLMLFVLTREFLQRNQSRIYRNQIGLILLGSVIASLTTLLFVVEIVEFDPSPIGFALMGLAYAGAVFRYRLLDITPIARDLVLDEMDSGMLVLDADGRIVDSNRRARDILERSDPTGETLSSILPSDTDLGDRFAVVREASETVSVDTDEGERHFAVEISSIEDPMDTYLGRVAIFTDITDQVENRRQLRRRTERLQRQNDRLDRFAALVSHDLRNPLQVATSSIELYRSNQTDDHLDRTERALDRMENIVDDLLLLARVGSDVTETEQVDLREAAIEARNYIDIDCSIEIDDTLPTVIADRDRLHHLFENLFRNAAEHGLPETDDGMGEPVTVTVGTLTNRPGFYVEDDGAGIPEDDRDDVFDHGYTTDPDGTGFGLSIVRDVVEAHGWSIDLVTAESGGARFEISGIDTTSTFADDQK